MNGTEILKLLILLSIVLSVLALALRANAADTLYLFREWRLGLRAFLAMFVAVPAIAMLIAYAFDLKPAVKIALIALAFSPVPPILPKKQIKAGGSASYITGLLVGAALMSLIAAPLGFALAGHIFGVETHVVPASIARTLGIGIAAPLALGLLAQHLFGDRARAIAPGLAKFAMILLMLCVVVLLVVLAPALGAVIGNGTLVALVAMSVVGLAMGRCFAGDKPENQSALSLAAAARHPGVAIGIALGSFPGEKLAIAAILLSTIINILVAIPYLRRLDRAEA